MRQKDATSRVKYIKMISNQAGLSYSNDLLVNLDFRLNGDVLKFERQ